VMTRVSRAVAVGTALCCTTLTLAATPAPAVALNPVKPICSVAGWVSGIVGKACGVLQNRSRLVNAGKKLLSGHPGDAAKALISGGVSKVGFAAGLSAVGVWVVVGAKTAVSETAKLIDHTTTPQLQTTWFSSTYWRMAGIAAVLTLPFLFAAAVQAVLRSDLALLARAALGYLPLAVLSVSIAAPVTMLLLAASDQMSAIVSSAAGGNAARALVEIGGGIGALSTYDRSAFLAFLLGLLLAGGALALWLELLVREAAVYVVVLMLPLAFAALVWPARRVWAMRAVELLVALILAKFAIVAVLTLAAAGLGHKFLSGPNAVLSGLTLVTLAAFAPWALLRLLPMAEVASGAAGSLRREAMGVSTAGDKAEGRAESAAQETDARLGQDGTARRESPSREAARSQTDGLASLEAIPAPAAAAAGSNGRRANGNGSAAADGSGWWDAYADTGIPAAQASPPADGSSAHVGSPAGEARSAGLPFPIAEGDAAGGQTAAGARSGYGSHQYWQPDGEGKIEFVFPPGRVQSAPVAPPTPGPDVAPATPSAEVEPPTPGPALEPPATDADPLPPRQEPEEGPL
jgi:hypothetical protein